jgi:hypothetical protein
MPPKKKPKTPPPPRGNQPRRVQAPQVRSNTRAPDDMGASHRKILYAVSGSGLVALIVVVLLVVLGAGGTPSAKKVANLMTAAGCTFSANKIVVPGGKTHIASLTGKFPWTTSPPDGGPHYPNWAVWGFYTQPVNPRMVVHNEEHGGVILWWGTKTPQSTVSQLKAFYDEQPTGTFGTPYANFGSRIAITAWTGNSVTYQHNGDYGEGHIAICLKWNAATKKAFEAFRNTYRGHGPEGIPLSADQAGMGP